MAAANLENQLQSAQKNLLFLQREHAGTLKGLHAEIRRLQQHCTDLTYELTLKSSEQTGGRTQQQRPAETLRGPGGAAEGEGAGARGAAARAGAEERGHRGAGDHRAGAGEAVPGGAQAQEPQAEHAVGGAGAARGHHRLPDRAAARHPAEAAQLQRDLGRQPRRQPRAGRLQARAPQGQAARDAPPPHEKEPLRPPAPRIRRGLQIWGREPETPFAGTGGCHARPHPVPAGQGVGRSPPHQGEAPGHPPHRFRPQLRREAQGPRGRGPPHPPRGPAAGTA
ncbi:coiled-coil domain-containing protein 92 isoform X2 [Myotis lucifugus]|uniref:coiled-coil domain-containing protein 92 isoform X2 n=1 Tax=Myotis lucifugus TaxID=59463 RepID=UPI000CCBF7BA|nr:coiled-coil domain-containing protein 92 isoform X2 [Myotis lucifugus]